MLDESCVGSIGDKSGAAAGFGSGASCEGGAGSGFCAAAGSGVCDGVSEIISVRRSGLVDGGVFAGAGCEGGAVGAGAPGRVEILVFITLS